VNITVNIGDTLIGGILLGCFYASVGLGFSLIWGIMNIVNLAQGALLILGGYVAYFASTGLGINPFISMFIAMAVLFAVGWLIQFIAINRVIRAPFLVTFMLTFGLDLLITNLMTQKWGQTGASITTAYSGVHFDTAVGTISFMGAAAAVIAVLLTAALSFFLSRTRIGNAILAVGMDRDAARLMGISVPRIYALTFGLGAALAGAAGTLLVMTKSVYPPVSGRYTLYSFVVVALGGLGTPWAALAGGLLFGLAEAFVGAFPQTTSLQDAIAFAILVLVLIVRPNGLLGKAFYS
jgi:branched-chain amino acid transport system permease protein